MGRLVDEGERNMRRWRNKGIVRTMRMVSMIAVGVGSRREENRFCEDSEAMTSSLRILDNHSGWEVESCSCDIVQNVESKFSIIVVDLGEDCFIYFHSLD